jgi:hypothetical protein
MILMADKPDLASRSMFHGQEAGFYMKIFLHPLDDYNDQFTARKTHRFASSVYEPWGIMKEL